ncbi:uncharacterized protein LOC119723388 [Patiria miniata]|uniref:Uncharacterized protein n=1 Tax=Patiria miniata TaxID=46514 RepID=A0A913ZG07_PATMI|nr:uncharacterized protein LOC119723388 [Patiria miniata]XP_038049930.1 uncharacterized protein LOC119723388 [Patiria miniata]XP_038049931.1 uncharacterized protein LOC119723388 [Patiria miniata]
MLGEYPDETDGKNHNSSRLQKLQRRLRRVMPGHQSHSASKDGSAGPGSKRDSAVSTSSELSEMEGGLEMTAMAYCTSCTMSATSQCDKDSDKKPADKTIVHIVSPQLGLLRVTDTPVETGNPVYKVDCKGKVGNLNTNIAFYFLGDTQCFFHVLDPTKSYPQAATEGVPLEEYTHRLCLFKKKDGSCVLAAHKAVCATPPFNDDPDALISVCYHTSKGGKVTLQANSCPSRTTDGMLWGADGDGEVSLFHKSNFPGYCTNPFTLFYMYDEVENPNEQRVDLKRTNGEV